MQFAASALTLAAFNTGNRTAANMAIMAITTRSSISVKPPGAPNDTGRGFEPVPGLIMVFPSRIKYLFLEPEELLVSGNRIGHNILSVDNGGSREICGPDCWRTQVGAGFQIEAGNIR